MLRPHESPAGGRLCVSGFAGDDTYVIYYSDATAVRACRQLRVWANNPELSLTADDARMLTRGVMQHQKERRREA
jgi:hypothetical protein